MLNQHRSVQRRLPKVRSDEAALTAAITELAASPLKVWAVLGSSKENAIKTLDVYEPAVVGDDDFFGMAFTFPTGRLE